jgi:hypothetical protein
MIAALESADYPVFKAGSGRRLLGLETKEISTLRAWNMPSIAVCTHAARIKALEYSGWSWDIKEDNGIPSLEQNGQDFPFQRKIVLLKIE